MPTPKSLRETPDRNFDDYILTSEIGAAAGLCKIPDNCFLQIPGNPGKSFGDDYYSDPIDLGFSFEFDGVIYKKILINTNGWMALLDPASVTGSFSLINFINSVFTANYSYRNENIKTTIIPSLSSNHILLAPWFDDLKTLSSNTSDLLIDENAAEKYQRGFAQPDVRLNPLNFGVQYYLDNKSSQGRRLVVRWNVTSASLSLTSTNVLYFEVVLYENGKIEYRYSPRKNLFSPFYSEAYENATVGIFAFKTSNMFRDFSYSLGYDKEERQLYKFGGAVYSSNYSDVCLPYYGVGPVTAKYGVNLNPLTNWPGQKNFGATLTFQPPLNRRRVLPRKSIKDLDYKKTFIKNGMFDDRRSIAYKNDVVNYPTTIPRFYGDSADGITDRQDLFSGEFFITASVVKSLIQDFIGNSKEEIVSPFNEYKLFENDPNASIDPFYKDGTLISDVGPGFEESLRSKNQIKLSMRVDHKTILPPVTSSIYYYNSKTRRWQYPTASLNSGFDLGSPYSEVQRLRLIETDRGFNATGFNISSGSYNRSIFSFATDRIFNSTWNRENEITALTKKYENSIQVSERYAANLDESFSLPIHHPFLIEKAVIEIPIEAGDGWFNDLTQCFIPVTDNAPEDISGINTFDIGGPALTVGLFNQIKTGQKTVRDLILSGTITHTLDNVAEIAYSNCPDIGSGDKYTSTWQIRPIGFKAYGGHPTYVISPISNNNLQFTGSAILKCQSSISNGTLIRDSIYIDHSTLSQVDALPYLTGSLETLFNTAKFINDRSTYFNFDGIGGTRKRTIINANNFGRGATGFNPSGRSILGKEFTVKSSETYDNPFYLYKNDSILNELKTIANDNPSYLYSELPEIFCANFVFSQAINTPSPYLVFPNDRLILSISKSRPYFFSTLADDPYTTGSIKHDIKLNTGSINITLYGSYVSNGKEYHGPLDQPLFSDAIHEVIIGEEKL